MYQWLSEFPALQAIEDPFWHEALKQFQEVRLPADVTVFREGQSCNGFLLVLDGCVRVQKLSENGREIVLYRVEPGQSCVLTTACLLAGEQYQAEGITETDVHAVLLPHRHFQDALDNSPGFRRFVFTAYGRRVTDLLILIDAVAFSRVDTRLAEQLLSQADADGQLKLTHQALARDLGTAREVISRVLKDFERKGILRLSRGRIDILDADALERAAEM